MSGNGCLKTRWCRGLWLYGAQKPPDGSCCWLLVLVLNSFNAFLGPSAQHGEAAEESGENKRVKITAVVSHRKVELVKLLAARQESRASARGANRTQCLCRPLSAAACSVILHAETPPLSSSCGSGTRFWTARGLV